MGNLNVVKFDDTSHKQKLIEKLTDVLNEISSKTEEEIRDNFNSMVIIYNGYTGLDIKYVNLNLIELLGILELTKIYSVNMNDDEVE